MSGRGSCQDQPPSMAIIVTVGDEQDFYVEWKCEAPRVNPSSMSTEARGNQNSNAEWRDTSS